MLRKQGVTRIDKASFGAHFLSDEVRRGLMSLLVRVMHAWERCAGSHMPQALIQSGRTGMYPLFSSIISSITHACAYMLLSILIFPHFPLDVQSLFPSGRPHLAPSPLSPLHSALVGFTARSSPRRHERSADGLFSSPPPSPYSSAVSVAAPCLGAPGCHGFSPHQATWPTVQFRQLTNPGSPGFRQSLGAD